MEQKLPVSMRDVSASQMYVGFSRYKPSEPSAPSSQRRLRVAGPSEKSWWTWNDPESKRTRRLARYKLYETERRFKASVRNGLCWLKRQCARIR